MAPERIDTIVRFDAVAKYGVKADGNGAGASAATLEELAGLIAAKELELPIARTYPLTEVGAAYAELAKGPHPRQDRADPLAPLTVASRVRFDQNYPESNQAPPAPARSRQQ